MLFISQSFPVKTVDFTRCSELEACFTLVNGILGVGVLGYPFAFRSCGMLAAALLIAICMAASQLSMRLMLLSSQLSGRRSYEELASAAFGPAGRQTVSSCIFTLNMGACMTHTFCSIPSDLQRPFLPRDVGSPIPLPCACTLGRLPP